MAIGDPALVAAIGALRENTIQVDESHYSIVDESIYLLVVLGRIWEWVVSTITLIGATLHRYLIEPFCKQDLELVHLRNRGAAPVGFTERAGRSGIHALLQMTVMVDTLGRVVNGFGTLSCAFEKVPAFREAVFALQLEEAELDAIIADVGGDEDEEAEAHPIQDALHRRASLEEALSFEVVRRALEDEGVLELVVEHLRCVKQLELFFAEYRRAQSEGSYVMRPDLERFFALCSFERLEDEDVTLLLSHLLPPVRLPIEVASHLQESRSFVPSQYVDTPLGLRRLQRSRTVMERGGEIRKLVSTKYEERALASAAALPPVEALVRPRRRERLVPSEQGVERRRVYIPLHLPLGDSPSLHDLLGRFARLSCPFDLAYTKYRVGKRAESRDDVLRRAFSYPPARFFLTLDRIQWQSQGISKPPIRVVNENELEIPLDDLRLPEDILITGESPAYDLTAFIAFDSETSKYGFYRQVGDGAWYEVIDEQMRGVPRPEACALVRRYGVILHYEVRA